MASPDAAAENPPQIAGRRPATPGPGLARVWLHRPASMKDGFPVSVAELLAAGERPHSSEAVAIVLDVCRQVMRPPAGTSVPPPISTTSVFLDGSGMVALAGGVPVEDDQTVQLLGRLLLQLLPAPDGRGVSRVPARLRLLATEAASGEGALGDVARLAAALRRFGPEHTGAAVRALFERWRGEHAARAAATLRNTAELRLRTDDRKSDDLGVPAASGTPAAQRGGMKRMLRLAAGTLLMLLGASAAYWLNADEGLPPLPVRPGFLIEQPTPSPRGVWELLPESNNLAVQARPLKPVTTVGTIVPAAVAPMAVSDGFVASPEIR